MCSMGFSAKEQGLNRVCNFRNFVPSGVSNGSLTFDVLMVAKKYI